MCKYDYVRWRKASWRSQQIVLCNEISKSNLFRELCFIFQWIPQHWRSRMLLDNDTSKQFTESKHIDEPHSRSENADVNTNLLQLRTTASRELTAPFRISALSSSEALQTYDWLNDRTCIQAHTHKRTTACDIPRKVRPRC